MTDEPPLRADLHGLGDSAPPEPPDRLERVLARAGRLRRRRQVAGAAAAVALVTGAAAAWVGLSPTEDRGPDRLTPAAPTALRLDLDLRPGTRTQLTARLRGTGSPSLRYGWQVRWGDGSEDRAYGSSACPDTTPGPVDELRTYSHRYPRPGTYQVQVRVTLCGEQQAIAQGQVRR